MLPEPPQDRQMLDSDRMVKLCVTGSITFTILIVLPVPPQAAQNVDPLPRHIEHCL